MKIILKRESRLIVDKEFSLDVLFDYPTKTMSRCLNWMATLFLELNISIPDRKRYVHLHICYNNPLESTNCEGCSAILEF